MLWIQNDKKITYFLTNTKKFTLWHQVTHRIRIDTISGKPIEDLKIYQSLKDNFLHRPQPKGVTLTMTTPQYNPDDINNINLQQAPIV